MMPPEFFSTEPCEVHLIDTSPVPTSATTSDDGRRAFAWYIADCEKCAIVPDVAGAFHWAWTHAAAVRQEAAGEIVTPEMIAAGAWAAREYMERTGGNSPEAVYRAMRGAALALPALAAPDEAEISTDGLGLDWVHSVLRWAASGYVHTPARMRFLRGAYRVVDRLVNEAARAPAVEVTDEQIITCAKGAAPDVAALDLKHIAEFLPTWRKFARAVLALARPASVQPVARLTDTRDAVFAECIAALRDVDDGDAPEFSACIEKLQELRMIAPRFPQGDAPMDWPRSRDVGRIGDMSPRAHLRVGFDSDSDVYVSVWSDDGGGGSVEFCTAGAGGGKSPRTREALIALMVAMEGENATDSGRDWWARRNGKPIPGAGGDCG